MTIEPAPTEDCEPHAVSTEVQKAQRFASIGMSLRHSGHFLVVTGGGGENRAISRVTGITTAK